MCSPRSWRRSVSGCTKQRFSLRCLVREGRWLWSPWPSSSMQLATSLDPSSSLGLTLRPRWAPNRSFWLQPWRSTTHTVPGTTTTHWRPTRGMQPSTFACTVFQGSWRRSRVFWTPALKRTIRGSSRSLWPKDGSLGVSPRRSDRRMQGQSGQRACRWPQGSRCSLGRWSATRQSDTWDLGDRRAWHLRNSASCAITLVGAATFCWMPTRMRNLSKKLQKGVTQLDYCDFIFFNFVYWGEVTVVVFIDCVLFEVWSLSNAVSLRLVET